LKGRGFSRAALSRKKFSSGFQPPLVEVFVLVCGASEAAPFQSRYAMNFSA